MNDRDRAATTTAPDGAIQNAWWGEYPFEIGAFGHWRVGPLGLWVRRTAHDWQIVHARDAEAAHDEFSLDVPLDPERVSPPAGAEQHRVGFAVTPGTLTLRPMLADRAVVARPESSFTIPPLEKVSVFVSTAVWIRLSCGPPDKRLLELPTWRSSDTWFGDNRSGTLCYATRTTMQLDVNALPVRPHRAVTPVLIDNRGHDALTIDRISLPIPNLSLFASPTGSLWTERLELKRTEHAELAQVHIDRERPPIPGAVRIGEPRTVGADNLMSRVFTGLFG